MTMSAAEKSRTLARQVDEWRIVPRLLIALYGTVCYLAFSWFVGLEDPTAAQTTFATAVWGAAAVWFKFYVDSGRGTPRE